MLMKTALNAYSDGSLVVLLRTFLVKMCYMVRSNNHLGSITAGFGAPSDRLISDVDIS